MKDIVIVKYGRHWAVYDGDELICVCVYKRGALEVQRRLSQHAEQFDRTSNAA
jgi:hypothetical protein